MTVKKVGQLLKQEAPGNFDAYNDIELSEEEKEEALFIARRNKYVSDKTLEYKKKLREETTYPMFSPTQLYQSVHDAKFEVDASNKQIIWNLCRYFAGDPNGPLDLRKGILLYGPVGCYKTSLMKFFRHNQSNSYCVFHVNDISAEFTKNGHDTIMRYKNLIATNNPELYFGQKEIGICFDDFGTEVDKKHYGNESNVMAEIILCRHNNLEKLRAKTHITTNLSADAIEERYGIRVRSRCREMFNIVAFPDDSPDRRK